MTYNLAWVRQRVLVDKLDDSSYNPSVVTNFINDAQKSVFNSYELPFMEKPFNGSLPVGGVTYSFPEDLQVIQNIKIVDPVANIRDITDLYLPFQEFNRTFPVPEENAAGVPSAWSSYGNVLYLNRPTDQAYTLRLSYLKKPMTLADDLDVPEIPEEFEELLVLGAYYRVLERNEDFDLAAFYKNGDYQDELEKLASRLGRRQTGKTMTVGQPMRMTRRSSSRR